MKFLPTINVYAPGIIDAIQAGQLTLQTGQWIKCGATSKSSRWCGITATGTLVATHPEGKTLTVDNERFKRHILFYRSRRRDR